MRSGEQSGVGRDLALEPLHGCDRRFGPRSEGDYETVGACGAEGLDPAGELIRRAREGWKVSRLVAQAGARGMTCPSGQSCFAARMVSTLPEFGCQASPSSRARRMLRSDSPPTQTSGAGSGPGEEVDGPLSRE